MPNNDPYEAALIENDPYEFARNDVIPNTENFLQRAIKSSRNIGLQGNFIPTSLNELQDLGRVGMNQIQQNFSPGLVGQVANFGSDRPQQKPIEFETDFGRNLNTAATVAPFAVAGLKGVPALGRGIGKGISKLSAPFKKFPVEQQKMTVQKAIDLLKEEAKEISYSGAKNVKDTMSLKASEANKIFGEKLSKMESSMNTDDFANLIAETADEAGVSRIPGHPLMSIFDSLIKGGTKTLAPREVQMMNKNILRLLGKDEVSKATFYRKFSEALPDSVPGLKELKASHAPIFSQLKSGKQIKQAGLSRIAKGNAPPTEVSDFFNYEKKFGSDVVRKAATHGEKIKSALKSIDKLDNDLQRIIRNQNRAKFAIGAAGGLGTLGGILKYIMSGKD